MPGQIPANYHAWSARVWGLLLFTSLLALVPAGNPALLTTALVVGALAQLESLAITAVLPQWRHDIKSVWHARHLHHDRSNVPA